METLLKIDWFKKFYKYFKNQKNKNTKFWFGLMLEKVV